MLRTRLFYGFTALILLFGVLSAWFGIGVIKDRIVQEAQTRVRLDLSSARSIYAAQLHEMETVVAIAASKRLVLESFEAGNWDEPELRARLEVIRRRFGFDFLSLVTAEGEVVLRTAPPYQVGDLRIQDPLVAQALAGETVSGTALMAPAELEQEAMGLAERAFVVVEDTKRAHPSPKTEEQRGMVMLAAEPVRKGPQVLGALYGGVLLNRNFDFIDHLHDVIYAAAGEENAPVGTATIFLHDSRITTTVRKEGGNRALGTRVSREVFEKVLDNGQPWIAKAFVVSADYLTAYEPIRDLDDRIIGMLYVGILEQPFKNLGRSIILRYVLLTGGVVLLSLVVAYFLAGRLATPIHRLVGAAKQLRGGAYPSPVPAAGASQEVGTLIQSFNDMSAALQERERKLNVANEDLRAVNRSYMETLGFVTHELNTPIASIMNYVYLLKNHALGPLTEKQVKAVRVMDTTSRRLVEMVRHYLNLSRIERGQLALKPKPLTVRHELLDPLVETFDPAIREREMRVDLRVPESLSVLADANFLAEVFENLLSNAVKYGREGGAITVSAEAEGEWARFTVRNDGEGIPAEDRDALFQKFVRLDSHGKKQRIKGTGLGLFITRSIVEAHGGTIEATSEPGQWAAFTFTVPLSMVGAPDGGAELTTSNNPEGGTTP